MHHGLPLPQVPGSPKLLVGFHHHLHLQWPEVLKITQMVVGLLPSEACFLLLPCSNSVDSSITVDEAQQLSLFQKFWVLIMQPKGSFCVKKWSFFVHSAGMKNIMHSSQLFKNFSLLWFSFTSSSRTRIFVKKLQLNCPWTVYICSPESVVLSCISSVQPRFFFESFCWFHLLTRRAFDQKGRINLELTLWS